MLRVARYAMPPRAASAPPLFALPRQRFLRAP